MYSCSVATAYLSNDWARQVTDCLNADERVKKNIRGQNVVVELNVTGAPQGDVVYAMRFEDDAATIVMGKPDRSDAQGTLTYDDSVAMSKGDLAGPTAVMTGKLAVTGDFEKVLRVGAVLNLLAEVSQSIDISY